MLETIGKNENNDLFGVPFYNTQCYFSRGIDHLGGFVDAVWVTNREDHTDNYNASATFSVSFCAGCASVGCFVWCLGCNFVVCCRYVGDLLVACWRCVSKTIMCL